MRLQILGRPRNSKDGTPASLLWNLETTRHKTEINMAEKLIVAIVKLRHRGREGQPPKPYVVAFEYLLG